jgi:hypothetical protein
MIKEKTSQHVISAIKCGPEFITQEFFFFNKYLLRWLSSFFIYKSLQYFFEKRRHE